MTEAAAARSLLDIKDEIVARTGCNTHGNIVEAEAVASFPGHNMIGTGCVTTYAQSSDNVTGFIVEREASAEHDDSTNGFADQRIVGLPEFLRIARKRSVGVGASHNTVQRITRLRGGVHIPRREREVVGAECIRRVGFFGLNQAAARPFCATIRSRKHHRADDPIAIHYRAPLLITQAAILSFAFLHRGRQSRLQLAVVGHVRAIRRILRKSEGGTRKNDRGNLCSAIKDGWHGDLLIIVRIDTPRRCSDCFIHFTRRIRKAASSTVPAGIHMIRPPSC